MHQNDSRRAMNIIDGSQNNYTYDYSHTDGNSINLDNTANIENMERNSRGTLQFVPSNGEYLT